MTVSAEQSNKRVYEASDDEEEGEGEENEGVNKETKQTHRYHRCVYTFLEKLMKVADTKQDDAAFQKEIVRLLTYLDAELMDREHRARVNQTLIDMHEKSNPTMKRLLKSKNLAFWKVDPSLPKI